MLRKLVRHSLFKLLVVSIVVAGAEPALAASSSQPHQHDPVLPKIMRQAAAQAAAPPSRELAPFQPVPKLSPRSSVRAGAPAFQGPSREVFGFVNAVNIADPQVGYPSWNFGLLTTVAFFGLHVNSQDGSLVTSDTGWAKWNSSDFSNLVAAAHTNGVRGLLANSGG